MSAWSADGGERVGQGNDSTAGVPAKGCCATWSSRLGSRRHQGLYLGGRAPNRSHERVLGLPADAAHYLARFVDPATIPAI
jgi:hypothetical protein